MSLRYAIILLEDTLNTMRKPDAIEARGSLGVHSTKPGDECRVLTGLFVVYIVDMIDSVVVGTAFKLIARPARSRRNRLPWAGFELAALSRGL